MTLKKFNVRNIITFAEQYSSDFNLDGIFGHQNLEHELSWLLVMMVSSKMNARSWKLLQELWGLWWKGIISHCTLKFSNCTNWRLVFQQWLWSCSGNSQPWAMSRTTLETAWMTPESATYCCYISHVTLLASWTRRSWWSNGTRRRAPGFHFRSSIGTCNESTKCHSSNLSSNYTVVCNKAHRDYHTVTSATKSQTKEKKEGQKRRKREKKKGKRGQKRAEIQKFPRRHFSAQAADGCSAPAVEKLWLRHWEQERWCQHWSNFCMPPRNTREMSWWIAAIFLAESQFFVMWHTQNFDQPRFFSWPQFWLVQLENTIMTWFFCHKTPKWEVP